MFHWVVLHNYFPIVSFSFRIVGKLLQGLIITFVRKYFSVLGEVQVGLL